ncbi:MAG: hypothetical protein QJR02_14255 [Sinobacteraceae bacterium]|nr:hypothetical protein [Nevskiaceae bacterium]
MSRPPPQRWVATTQADELLVCVAKVGGTASGTGLAARHWRYQDDSEWHRIVHVAQVEGGTLT